MRLKRFWRVRACRPHINPICVYIQCGVAGCLCLILVPCSLALRFFIVLSRAFFGPAFSFLRCCVLARPLSLADADVAVAPPQFRVDGKGTGQSKSRLQAGKCAECTASKMLLKKGKLEEEAGRGCMYLREEGRGHLYM